MISYSWFSLVNISSQLNLPNPGFTWLNSANVSVSSESLFNPRFNSVQLVYFLVNFSVIFTRLILGLRSLKSGWLSLKSGLRTLRTFKTFFLISLVNTWLNLTNLQGLSRLNHGLFVYKGIVFLL